jgi:predicted ATPase
LLEALDSLLQGVDRDSVLPALRLTAPTWYAQVVPSTSLDQSTVAASQERVKRELTAFFQEISRVNPVVVFLDDVHWADVSTIDLLNYLGTKFDSMRTLIVITYRVEEMLLAKHPFMAIKLDLQGRGSCREIGLGFLTRQDVENYFALEFPGHRFPKDLVGLIHQRTEGSPLFMVDLMRYLRDRGVIAEHGGQWTLAQSIPHIERELPESIRSMIERKIDRLTDDDRRLLVAASAQGQEFDSAVVSKALNLDPGQVEERLAVLDRVHVFVRLMAEQDLPDGTPTLRYRFVHVLYQHSLFESLKAARKVSLSAAIAHALLDHYGDHNSEVATQLALLFENARDFSRATHYFWLAAENAARVSAHPEALVLARRGLSLLKSLPDNADRAERELKLLITLGVPLTATEGFAASEVTTLYARAQELFRQIDKKTLDLFPVLLGLLRFQLVRGSIPTAHELGQELMSLAEHSETSQDSTVLIESHRALGVTSFFLGEFRAAFAHLEASTRYGLAQRPRSGAFADAVGAQLFCANYAALNLWLLGYPDQALKKSQQALSSAQGLSDPYSLALTLTCAAMVRQFRGEPSAAQDLAEAVGRLASSEHKFPMYSAFATLLRGWASAAQGQVQDGILQMRDGLAAGAAFGLTWRPFFLGVLANIYSEAGQLEQARATLEEASQVMDATGERWWDAEVHRLDGILLHLQGCPEIEVEACFRQAMDVARRQEARSLELRIAMSAYLLGQRHDKRQDAQGILSEVYGRFAEGFDTADLTEARNLLNSAA